MEAWNLASSKIESSTMPPNSLVKEAIESLTVRRKDHTRNHGKVGMPLQESPQMEPLFDDDQLDVPATAWGIRMRLNRVKRIEEAQAKLDQQFADAQAWFNAQAERYNKQIEYEREQMRNQLIATGEKSIPTDLGTVSLRKAVKKHWPEPDALMAWAKQEGIIGAIKTKDLPVMKVIDKYVTDTGSVPPGYTTEDTLGISIRQPNSKQVADVPKQLPEAA